MSDRLKQAQDRFTEIKLDLELPDLPEDTGARLEAVVSWLDSASGDGSVPVRATQILLIDPEVPGAARRGVVKQVYRTLGERWVSKGADALNLLQAMVLAARPEAGVRPFDLVGLIGAGWEIMVGREQMREAVAPWRAFRAGSMEGAWRLGIGTAVGAAAVGGAAISPDETAKMAAFKALQELRTNFQAGWNYSQYSGQLLTVLSYVDGSLKGLVDSDKALSGQLAAVAPNLRQLHEWKGVGHTYDGFAGQLIPWTEAMVQVLSALGVAVPGLHLGWQTLKANRGTGWSFDGLSPHLLPVLDALMDVVSQLHDRRRLDASVLSVSAALSSARPAEIELLWWGQARYCHSYSAPFRSLLKAPERRTQAFYAAISEAADRAWRLAPEPAAAYLVEVLSGFGFDVDTNRPVSDWLRELSNHLPPDDAPSGPLARLATEDAIGMPVTWARLHPRFTEDDVQLATTLGLHVHAEIDLGTWATWILRERVLERRMRE